jgi:hypothetical protein
MRLLIVVLLLLAVEKTFCTLNATIDNITSDDYLETLEEIRAGITSSSLRSTSTKIKATVSVHSDEAPTAAIATKSGKEIFQNALKKAIGGGIPGAVAGAIQVICLMWLRTVTNYQYRYGSNFFQALSHLYGNGGIPRLYSGLGFALLQAPLSRFVSTAANDGVHNLIQNLEWTKHWGPGREVVVAALVVGLFRMVRSLLNLCI